MSGEKDTKERSKSNPQHDIFDGLDPDDPADFVGLPADVARMVLLDHASQIPDHEVEQVVSDDEGKKENDPLRRVTQSLAPGMGASSTPTEQQQQPLALPSERPTLEPPPVPPMRRSSVPPRHVSSRYDVSVPGPSGMGTPRSLPPPVPSVPTKRPPPPPPEGAGKRTRSLPPAAPPTAENPFFFPPPEPLTEVAEPPMAALPPQEAGLGPSGFEPARPSEPTVTMPAVVLTVPPPPSPEADQAQADDGAVAADQREFEFIAGRIGGRSSRWPIAIAILAVFAFCGALVVTFYLAPRPTMRSEGPTTANTRHAPRQPTLPLAPTPVATRPAPPVVPATGVRCRSYGSFIDRNENPAALGYTERYLQAGESPVYTRETPLCRPVR